MPYPSPRGDPEIASILALESVPPVTTTRWNARRKAQVARAVQAGLLNEQEACRLYRMTVEELISWQSALCESGERGLHVTKQVRSKWSDSLDAGWRKALQDTRHERVG